MPGIIHVFYLYLILHAMSVRKYYYYPHFTDQKLNKQVKQFAKGSNNCTLVLSPSFQGVAARTDRPGNPKSGPTCL